MTYRVNADKVAAEVAQLSAAVRHFWNVCLKEIAIDPHPRDGTYAERALLPPFQWRTHLYWITEESPISGEVVLIFTAEFFPEFQPVYVINEQAEEVVIFYLREGR